MDKLPIRAATDLHRHGEILDTGIPSVRNAVLAFLKPQFEGRERGLPEVLIEYRGQILAGLLVEELHEILGHDIAIFEPLTVIAKEFPPLSVIIDDRAQGVEEKRALEILILRGIFIDLMSGNNRLLVSDFRFIAIDVFESVLLSEHGFDIDTLGVSRPPFVDPLVRDIAGSNAVAEPFMRAFVNDNEVKLQADSNAGPIPLEVPVGELVAVGDCALMLHPGVRHFNELVSVFLEGIITEILLKSLQHRFRLCELSLGAFQILGQTIVIQGEITELIAEVFVAADIE